MPQALFRFQVLWSVPGIQTSAMLSRTDRSHHNWSWSLSTLPSWYLPVPSGKDPLGWSAFYNGWKGQFLYWSAGILQKVYKPERQCHRQGMNPGFMDIDPGSESCPYNKAQQILRHKFLSEDHQAQDQNCLKNVCPDSQWNFGKTSENAYGTLEIAEIPDPEYNIRTTPRLLITSTIKSASSPLTTGSASVAVAFTRSAFPSVSLFLLEFFLFLPFDL